MQSTSPMSLVGWRRKCVSFYLVGWRRKYAFGVPSILGHPFFQNIVSISACPWATPPQKQDPIDFFFKKWVDASTVEDCLFLVFILGGRVVYVSFEQAFLNPFYFIVWVVPIFCFCSESVPHVYVHRASDLRGLLQPTASPRVEAVQDSIQGHRIYSCVHW